MLVNFTNLDLDSEKILSGTEIPLAKILVLAIRIRMFLGLPDLDPLVRGMDPDPAPALFS
jgi:hypothetical protein